MRYKNEIHHQIRHFIKTGVFDRNTINDVVNVSQVDY